MQRYLQIPACAEMIATGGGTEMHSSDVIKNRILNCFLEFDESGVLEPDIDEDPEVIELHFEPNNSAACQISIQLIDVGNRPPWITLSAGTGLKFEWYDGCNYPDICCFVRAVAAGNVRETVTRWRKRYIGSSGWIEIDGIRYESSYKLGCISPLLSKAMGKAVRTEMRYEPWDYRSIR